MEPDASATVGSAGRVETRSGYTMLNWIDTNRRSWHARAYVSAALIPLDCAAPLRRGHQREDAPNQQGRYFCATTGTMLWHESMLERTAMMLVDRDPSVVGVSCQPVEFLWPKNARVVRHIPDLFIRRHRQSNGLIDVHAPRRLTGEFALHADLMAKACAEIGWSYDVFTGVDPVYEANLRWLSSYRHTRYRPPARLFERLCAAYGLGTPLIDGASTVAEDPRTTLPYVFHLLWNGSLLFDWSKPLRLWTPLHRDTHEPAD